VGHVKIIIFYNYTYMKSKTSYYFLAIISLNIIVYMIAKNNKKFYFSYIFNFIMLWYLVRKIILQ